LRVKLRAVKRGLGALCVALPLALSTGAAWAIAGCTSSSAPVIYTPITGIVIRSSQLVAGRGCGTAPDQVYAYVAVLSFADAPDGALIDGGWPVPYSSAVVPCYTDGVFSNLQSPSGSYDYVLHIYAYNYASFPQALACTPPRFGLDCPGDYPEASTAAVASSAPNWETTCTAVEQQGIPVLADCLPLEPPRATPDSGVTEGGLPDAGVPEGGVLDGGGEADAGPPDGSGVDAGAADGAGPG
jgi:hypothetical protein